MDGEHPLSCARYWQHADVLQSRFTAYYSLSDVNYDIHLDVTSVSLIDPVVAAAYAYTHTHTQTQTFGIRGRFTASDLYC